MNYSEYNNCVKILQSKSNWISVKSEISGKMDCLEKFKAIGSPSHISFLVEILKDSNEIIRLKAAEAIIHLYQQLKTQNDLYDSLKYVPITVADIDYFKKTFDPEIYCHLLLITSMNKSGYLREKAIKELAGMQKPKAIRFFLLRLGDWVAAVRNSAHEGIRSFFKPQFTEAFIKELPLIEWLLKVQRTNLATIHAEIFEFVLKNDLTNDFYKKLERFDERSRLIYFRAYLKAKVVSDITIKMISKDRSMFVRIEVIKYLKHLEPLIQKEFIISFLKDRSARVRIKALYETKNFPGEFEVLLLEMCSDESALVRELVRYLLKEKYINFADIYRQRINQNFQLIGTIPGLSEVGTKDDLPYFEKCIQSPSSKVKLASLVAIHRLDKLMSIKYSLALLTHSSQKIRNKCVENLSGNFDFNIYERARTIYKAGNVEQRITVLHLFNQVSEWRVVSDFMIALTDSEKSVQDLAWLSLQRWKVKAVSRFISPPELEIKRANEIYRQLEHSVLKTTVHRDQLWKELPFFLR